jgi:ABC-type uncharacterized transport system substrate-binding protein
VSFVSKHHEESVCGFCINRFAVCALPIRRGTAARETSAGRIPERYISFHDCSPHGCISPGTARTRIRRRQSIVVDFRYAEGKVERLSALAAELVRLKVDAIVTAGPTVTRPAKQATSAIPIIMTFDDDPVGSGFAASLARPGSNITGLSTLNPEIAGRQLELLKQAVLKLSRVAVLGPSTRPGTAQALKEIEIVARSLSVKPQYFDVREHKDIETAFREAGKGHVEAVLILQGPAINSKRTEIVELAAKSAYLECTIRQSLSKTAGL